MAEQRFLVMVLTAGDRRTGSSWAALEWPGVGRVLTRGQAEMMAAQTEAVPRFLLPYREGMHDLARGGTWVLPPGESMWSYGRPLRGDLRAVLRAAAGAPSPDALPAPRSGSLPVSISTVCDIAGRWLGETTTHELQVAFDELMFDVGGTRDDGPPPVYFIPVVALGLA